MGILRDVKPEFPKIIFGRPQSFSKATFWEGNFESVTETGETFRFPWFDSAKIHGACTRRGRRPHRERFSSGLATAGGRCAATWAA
jgi:hypothetical protein